MHWTATDQFGNLYIGESEAVTVDDLAPDLASLVEELQARVGESFQVTIDLDYTEISGPTPDHVSHILRVPNLVLFHSDQAPAEIRAEIAQRVEQACAERGLSGIAVELA